MIIVPLPHSAMNEVLRSALDAVPVGVGLVADDLRVLYANPRLATMLHTDVAALVGSDLSGWMAIDARAASDRRMRARFSGPAVEFGVRFAAPGVDAYVFSALTLADGSPAALFIAADAADASSRGEDKRVLDLVAAAVSSKVGDDFFTSLVLALTRSLEVDYALVGEVTAGGAAAQVIAAAVGDQVMAPIQYDLDGTPCAEVLKSDLCWHVSGVQQEFPRDRLLVEMGAEAYAAVPLRDSTGRAIGLLAILHKSRLPVYGHLQSALQIVAVRAAAELERRQRERDLTRAHRYLDDLIETASALIVEIDHAGRLLRTNRCFEEVTGYARAELQDEGWMERLQPPDRFPAASQEVRRYLREGWPREVEAPLLTRGGEERTIAWRNSAVRDEAGRAVGTLSVGLDVTERRRAEAERERLQESLRRSATLSAVGSLVAGVAHEVRNPLFGIAATLDAFEAEVGAPPAVREYLDVLRSDIGRLRRLMDDLLVYGRPLTLTRQVQPLAPLVADALRSVRGRAAARGVELASDLDEQLPQVPLDSDRMLQVLNNLLENAVELCAPAGVVTVTARYEGDESPPLLVVAVRDQGPGFRSEDLPRLFEPFFSRRRGGSGLGLAIVQKIVGDHGGEVRAGNAAGGGAVVEVRLPVLRGVRHAARQSAAG